MTGSPKRLESIDSAAGKGQIFDFAAEIDKADKALAYSPHPDYSIVRSPDGSAYLRQLPQGSMIDLGSTAGARAILGIVRRSCYSDMTAMGVFAGTVNNRNKPLDYLRLVGTDDDEIDQVVARLDGVSGLLYDTPGGFIAYERLREMRDKNPDIDVVYPTTLP